MTAPQRYLADACERLDRLLSLLSADDDYVAKRKASQEFDEAFHEAVHALKRLGALARTLPTGWSDVFVTGIVQTSANAPASVPAIKKLELERDARLLIVERILARLDYLAAHDMGVTPAGVTLLRDMLRSEEERARTLVCGVHPDGCELLEGHVGECEPRMSATQFRAEAYGSFADPLPPVAAALESQRAPTRPDHRCHG